MAQQFLLSLFYFPCSFLSFPPLFCFCWWYCCYCLQNIVSLYIPWCSGTHSIAYAILEHMILLPQSFGYWDYRHAVPCLDFYAMFKHPDPPFCCWHLLCPPSTSMPMECHRQSILYPRECPFFLHLDCLLGCDFYETTHHVMRGSKHAKRPWGSIMGEGFLDNS